MASPTVVKAYVVEVVCFFVSDSVSVRSRGMTIFMSWRCYAAAIFVMRQQSVYYCDVTLCKWPVLHHIRVQSTGIIMRL